jgi:hypothetical protein
MMVSLASHLIQVVQKAFGDPAVFIPGDLELDESVMQRIGEPGNITIADIKLGRGADIRPDRDIPGGLHVIVATEVAHKRLLKQMIGRTGRVGREGSYSIIVLHRVLSEPSPHAANSAWWVSALHHLTALGVYHAATLDGRARKEFVQKWLVCLYGCRVRGRRNPAEWCISEGVDKMLRELIPATGAAIAFYEHLDALKDEGFDSVQ